MAIIKRPKLKDLLETLLNAARAEPGVVKTITLGRGLRVALRVNTLEGQTLVHLALGREGVFPSRQKWEIVCRDLGWPDIEHTERTEERRAGFIRTGRTRKFWVGVYAPPAPLIDTPTTP